MSKYIKELLLIDKQIGKEKRFLKRMF